MMPCTRVSDRDFQTQSVFCKALGLLAIHPLPMEEEPPLFAPTIGERVKRNLLLSNKVVSYKNYYGNKDVTLKLRNTTKLNKKKNSARKSSRGKAPALSKNKPVEKQFLSPLTNLKSISHSYIKNEFYEDNCRSLAQNLPFVNNFELSLEESHCQQVVSFYSPEKPTADSHLHLNKNDCNYSSPFKIKACCVLLTKCPPIIHELTSDGLPTNSLFEPMSDPTFQSAASASESVICVPSAGGVYKDSSLNAMTGAYVQSVTAVNESVIYVPSLNDLLKKRLLEPSSEITVKSAASGSESVICVPSTDVLHKVSLPDFMTGAHIQCVMSGNELVIHEPCTDDLPNKTLLKPSSDITNKFAASVCESVISVPSTDDLCKDNFLDVVTSPCVHFLAQNYSKQTETILDNYNLPPSTQSLRQNFAPLTESRLASNFSASTSKNIPDRTSGHYEVERSLSYCYGEKESSNVTLPMNVSVESNTYGHLPDFSVEGSSDGKCNVSDLLTLESGSSSPANFTIQIETQEELETQENLLSSAQESALHISEVFSLASSSNSTCSSSTSASSLKGVSSEESDDNSSLAMEEAFHLPRIVPHYGVISSQSTPFVTSSIQTDKFLLSATTQNLNKNSSVDEKLYGVVATENRCGSGVDKISKIIGHSEAVAVETHGGTNESSSISGNIGGTTFVTSNGGNQFSGISDNVEATPVVSSEDVSKFSAPVDSLGNMPVVMSDVINEFSNNGYRYEDTPVPSSDIANEISDIDDNFEATLDLPVDDAIEFHGIVNNCESIPVSTGDFVSKFSTIIDNCEAAPVVVEYIANELPGIIETLPTTTFVTSVYPSKQSSMVKYDVNQSQSFPKGNIETFPSLMHSQSMISAAITGQGTDVVCEEASQCYIMNTTSSSDILTECLPKALEEPSATVLLHNNNYNVSCEDILSSGPYHLHRTPVCAAQTQTEELSSACHIPSNLIASTCSKVADKHKSDGQSYYECDNCQCRYLDVMLLVKHLLMHHSNTNQSDGNVQKSQTILCNDSKERQEQLMRDIVPTLPSTHVDESLGSTMRRHKTNFSPRRSGRLVHSPLTSNNRTEFSNDQEMSVNFSRNKNLTKKRGISCLKNGNNNDDTFQDRRAKRTILENSNGDLPNNFGESKCLDYTANKHQKTKDTKNTTRTIQVTRSEKREVPNTVSNKDYKANSNSQQTIKWNCSVTNSIQLCQSSSDQLKDSSTVKGIFSTSVNNRINTYPVAVSLHLTEALSQTEVDNLHLENSSSNSSTPVCADEGNDYASPDNVVSNATSSNSTCRVSSSIRTKKSFTGVSGFVSKDMGTSNMELEGSLADELDLSECDCSDIDFEGFSPTDVTTSCELEGNETWKQDMIKSIEVPSIEEHLPGDNAPTLGTHVCPESYISRTSDSTVTDLYTSSTSTSQSVTSMANICTSISDIQSNSTAKEPQHTVLMHNNTLTKEISTSTNNIQFEGPSTESQHTAQLGESSRIIKYSNTNSPQVLYIRNSVFENTNDINTPCTIIDHLDCVGDNLNTPVINLDDGLNVVETAQQSSGSRVSPVILLDDGLRVNETSIQSPFRHVSPVILLDDGLRASKTAQQSLGSQASPVVLLDDESTANETTQQLSSSNQTSLCSPLGAIQCNEDLNVGCSQRRFSQDKPRLEVNDEAEVLFENTVLPKCEEKFLSSYYSYGSARTLTSDLGTNLSVEEIDQLMKRCRPLTVVAKRHLVIIDGEKKFKCHECLHLVFDSLPLLRHHYSNIHGHGLKCIFCSQSFEHVGHLRLHLLNHGQVIKFKCTSCCAVFGRALDLQSHSCLCDAPPTLFKCHQCQSIFISNSALQLHISSTHFQDMPFKCELCSSTCQLHGECVDHMKPVHNYNSN